MMEKKRLMAAILLIALVLTFVAAYPDVCDSMKYRYSGRGQDSQNCVQFGDMQFFVKKANAAYMDEGAFDMKKLAGEYGQSATELTKESDLALIYECIPEYGTEFRIHGAREDVADIPYLEGCVYSGYPCIVRIYFNDSAKERTIKLADGSSVSPLMAYLAQFMLDSMRNHPEEFAARFQRLERSEREERVEISVR